MNSGDFEGEELLLRRLREAASGDAGVRQLRRRYDSLRGDYEQLLDRLADLEERLEEPAKRPPASQTTVAGVPTGSISEALATPLIRLRDEYLAAATRIQTIASGLEVLAAGSLKGQHGPRDSTAAEPVEGNGHRTAEPAPEPEVQPEGRLRKVHIDLRGSGFGELLDFQERLSAVQGVSRVSINAIDADRATLIVELGAQASEAE